MTNKHNETPSNPPTGLSVLGLEIGKYYASIHSSMYRIEATLGCGHRFIHGRQISRAEAFRGHFKNVIQPSFQPPEKKIYHRVNLYNPLSPPTSCKACLPKV